MSINLTDGTIPFTELYERLMTMARMDSFNNEDYAKGLSNDVYIRVLPRLTDWNPLIEESSIATTASYATGVVACTAGTTAIVGTGTAWTAAMTAANGWRIKFAGNDNIYTFTYVGAANATISPALSGASNLSGATYNLWQEEYQLPYNFDRFLRNGSFYVLTGGRTTDTIEESARDEFREDYRAEPMDPVKRIMLTGTHATTGYRQLRVNPGPRTAKLYPIEYIKKVPPMSEYTVGSISVTNGDATITGTGTSWLANVVAGDYFRVDNNGRGDSSKWYRVSSVTSNTELELTTTYGESTESALEYTICKAPSAFPTEFHEFILYEAVLTAITSQEDPAVSIWAGRRQDVLNSLLRNYKSRRTNQQFGVDDDGYRS